MRIVIARERCTSCGNCVLAAPNIFDLDEDDARVVLLNDTPASSELVAVRAAQADCPADVIDLVPA